MKFLKKCFSCCIPKNKNIENKSEVSIDDITKNELSQDIKNLKNITELYKFESGKRKKKIYKYNNILIEKLELKNICQYVRVIDVYDADTFKCIIFYRNIPTIISIRLSGIDTPEIKPKTGNIEEKKQEKALAIISRIYFMKLIMGCENILYIKTNGSDKYGRTLAEIYKSHNEDMSINQTLINMRLADTYYGNTKEKNFKKSYLCLEKSDYIINFYENKKNTFIDIYNELSKLYPMEDIIC